MLAGMTTAGAVAVAIYALGEGDLIGAALEFVFMAPVLNFIGKGAQTVAFKVGEQVVGHIPVELLARFAKLPESVKSKFSAVFRSGKGDAEVLADTERLLKQEGVVTTAEAAAGLTIRAGKDGLNEFAVAWQYGFRPYGKFIGKLRP